MATSLMPRLVVRGADAALAFYQRVFNARVEEKFAEESGHVVQAVLSIDGIRIAVTEERREWNNEAPPSLEGSPVILNLFVDDADAIGARMTAAGAEVIFPIADQFYGRREGRFQDPFGHIWIISTVLETLSADEIRARMARQR